MSSGTPCWPRPCTTISCQESGCACTPPMPPCSRRAAMAEPPSSPATLGNEIDSEAVALTSEALHLVPEQPPTAFRARLLAVHARVALIMGQEVDAERTAREAVAVSEAVGCRTSATDARTTLAQLA